MKIKLHLIDGEFFIDAVFPLPPEVEIEIDDHDECRTFTLNNEEHNCIIGNEIFKYFPIGK
jgi:hypothetical protein